MTPVSNAGRSTTPRRHHVSGGPPDKKSGLVLPDVLQFMQLLWALDHDLQRTSKRMLRGFGVTGPQRLALRLIGEFPGISPGELAALLHVHPSTLTGILSRLLEGQLIVRETHADDARRSLLRLSRRGARVDAIRAGTIEHAVDSVLRQTSRADQRCVARVLRHLTEALQSNGNTPAADAGDRRRSRQRSRVRARLRLIPDSLQLHLKSGLRRIPPTTRKSD
jgi:MarR family transcriptional regulator, organic hydroperoxide resistance regulator